MKLVRFSIEKCPEELRNRFKIWCLQHGTTMTEEIIRLMRWSVENGQEGKLPARQPAGGDESAAPVKPTRPERTSGRTDR